MGTYGDSQAELFLEGSAVRRSSDQAGKDIRLLALEPPVLCFTDTGWPFPTCKHDSTRPGSVSVHCRLLGGLASSTTLWCLKQQGKWKPEKVRLTLGLPALKLRILPRPS